MFSNEFKMFQDYSEKLSNDMEKGILTMNSEEIMSIIKASNFRRLNQGFFNTSPKNQKESAQFDYNDFVELFCSQYKKAGKGSQYEYIERDIKNYKEMIFDDKLNKEMTSILNDESRSFSNKLTTIKKLESAFDREFFEKDSMNISVKNIVDEKISSKKGIKDLIYDTELKKQIQEKAIDINLGSYYKNKVEKNKIN